MQIDGLNLHDPRKNFQSVVRNTEVSLNDHRIALQQQVVFHTAVNPQNHIASALADRAWHCIAEEHFIAWILPSNRDLRETIQQGFQFATAQRHGSGKVLVAAGWRVSGRSQTIRPVGACRLQSQISRSDHGVTTAYEVNFISCQSNVCASAGCPNDRSRFCGEDRTGIRQLNVNRPMQADDARVGDAVTQQQIATCDVERVLFANSNIASRIGAAIDNGHRLGFRTDCVGKTKCRRQNQMPCSNKEILT